MLRVLRRKQPKQVSKDSGEIWTITMLPTRRRNGEVALISLDRWTDIQNESKNFKFGRINICTYIVVQILTAKGHMGALLTL